MKTHNATQNNCLQCCVAGILDLGLEDVLDFNRTKPNNMHWFEYMATYLEGMHGVVCHVLSPDKVVPEPTIGIYHKEGRPTGHAVIMKGDVQEEILHNPYVPRNMNDLVLIAKIKLVKEEICFQTPN